MEVSRKEIEMASLLRPYQKPTQMGAGDDLQYLPLSLAYYGIVLGSGILSGYHGSKRHCGSLGWGLVWGFLGTAFPVIVPVIGVAQGFGKEGPSC